MKIDSDLAQPSLDRLILLPQRRGLRLALEDEFAVVTKLMFELFLVIGLALAMAYLSAPDLCATGLMLSLISYSGLSAWISQCRLCDCHSHSLVRLPGDSGSEGALAPLSFCLPLLQSEEKDERSLG